MYTNNMVDVLVSCGPTPKPCKFNGKDANLELIEMYGTSMPLYLGFWTSNDFVKSSVFNRSNDIDLTRMDSLQIDEIVNQITVNHKTDCL